MTAGERAFHVCTTCRARKKACNKNLPYCGYCSKRGINCSYDVDDGSSPDNNVDAGMPFLLFSVPLQDWKQYSRGKVSRVFPEQLTPLSEDSPSNGRHALDTMLNSHVNRILQDVGLSLNEISEQYFRGFHKWLPIICPSLFEGILSQYIIPPADFSVLALAICLVALRPPYAASKHSSADAPEPF